MFYKEGDISMTASEMRAITNQAGRAEHERKAYACFDKKIREAAMDGRNRIFFGFDGGYIDEDTGKWVSRDVTGITREDGKEHYKKLGFRFEHVGVIGGVMQARDQENIVW